MNGNMSVAYEQAQAKSYCNQQGGITIPAEKLGEIIEIIMGSHPLGIAHREFDGKEQLVFASYWEPSLCLVDVFQDETGLHLKPTWIRNVNHGTEIVRIFPGRPQFGDLPRAQTVNFAPDGCLWASRNGDRQFIVLQPPTKARGCWTAIKWLNLPGEGMVHSALLIKGRLITTESTLDLKKWRFCNYFIEQQKDNLFFSLAEKRDEPPFTYGIAKRSGRFWTVTDFRSKEPTGIYEDGEIKVAGIHGNGLCFLKDGSAVVSRYGHGHPGPFNGIPGALIYIPAQLT